MNKADSAVRAVSAGDDDQAGAPRREDAVTGRPHLAVVGGKPGSVERRKIFEHAHPEVTIVPPGTMNDPWRAIVRPGDIPRDPAATTVSSWQLAGPMDQLDEFYPPARGNPDPEPACADL